VPGHAGLDQIVFDVPEGTTGCDVSLRLDVNGVTSNFSTIAIGESGSRVRSGTAGFDGIKSRNTFLVGESCVPGISSDTRSVKDIGDGWTVAVLLEAAQLTTCILDTAEDRSGPSVTTGRMGQEELRVQDSVPRRPSPVRRQTGESPMSSPLQSAGSSLVFGRAGRR
jgi:hypothetical protein